MLNAVRGLDLFAVPVSLTYKGNTKFNTLCGGCLSLVMILSLLTYAVMDLHFLMVHPVLTGNSERTYFSLINNTDAYRIPTQESTLAVSI